MGNGVGDIAIQLIGIIAMLIVLASYQPKYRKHILHSQLVANILWVVHFSLLGATTGAALNAVSAVRMYLFGSHLGSALKRSIWPILLIMVLAVFVSILVWEGWLSLLPLIGILFSTIAFWQHDPQRIRLLLLCTSPLWLIYNYLSGSYAGVLTELLAVASIFIALWRHSKTTKQQRVQHSGVGR